MVVKILMNPFYKKGSPFSDPYFERSVREIATHRLVPTS